MNAPPRRRPPEPEPRPVSAVAGFLAARRSGLGAILVAAAAVAAGWFVWTKVRDQVRAAADTVLYPEAVELRGVPDWVRGDLKAEALRTASLDAGMPLDDPRLTDRLRRAFEMHPWVREVTAVELRQPAAAAVAVRCREPVAMVGVKGGLLAVDAEAVVLPSADFTAEQAAAYPRITLVQSTPLGLEGTPWGDPVVEEGAAVAAAIGPEWRALGLHDLKPVAVRRGRVWELVGDDGRTVVFGSAPGREFQGEPSAAVKIARLKELVARPEDAAQRSDLTAEPPPVAPRPAPAGAGREARPDG
jgi:hypothetical protein